MAVTLAQLEPLYLAYLGRPADSDGVAFFTSSGSALEQIETAFASSAESAAFYGSSDTRSFVNAIYNNLFGRNAEPAGLAYWVGQLANGAFSVADAALVILQAARNDDALAVANKLAAATAFTEGLALPADSFAYQGDAAAAVARGWLASVGPAASTLDTALAVLPSVRSDIVAVGGPPGATYRLAGGVDTLAVPDAGLVDTVAGVVDFSGGVDASTFSAGDSITGNSHTVLDLVLQDTTGGRGDRASLSGISLLNFTNTSTAVVPIVFDARGWKDVANIDLEGTDGAVVTVQGLADPDTALGLKVEGATDGTLVVSGVRVGTAGLAGKLKNTTHNSLGAFASFGGPGVDVVLGDGGYACFSMAQTNKSNSAAVTVGDLAVAHVHLMADNASASFARVKIANSARARSHDASAGSLSLGDVAVSAGSGCACFTADNIAVATVHGNAVVGNLIVGAVHGASDSGSKAYLNFVNFGCATQGDAITGNLTLDTVTLVGVEYVNLAVTDEARVVSRGHATAGALTIGDLTLHATGLTHTAHLCHSACSYKGSAQVGSLTLGNLDMTSSFSNGVLVVHDARAAGTGTAAITSSVGALELGNLAMAGSGVGSNELTLRQFACLAAGQGAATVGDVGLGSANLRVDSGVNAFMAEVSAINSGTGDARVGSLTVGNVALSKVNPTYGGGNCFDVQQYAYAARGHASVGDIGLGDVSINAGGTAAGAGSDCLMAASFARAPHGMATAGNITVGNITAREGINGAAGVRLCLSVTGSSAASATGKISVGNVVMHGSRGASLHFSAYNSMCGNDGGTAGGIQVGDVAMVNPGGCVHFEVTDFAQCGDVRDVKVGNVNISASSLQMFVYNSAQQMGAAGTVAVGNVALKGAGCALITQTAHAGSAGTLTVGDVSLSVGSGQDLILCVSNSSETTLGTVQVGNIGLALDGTDAGAPESAKFHLSTSSRTTGRGDIVAGNITIGSSGVTAGSTLPAGAIHAEVYLYSFGGNVTVGNITVTGGASDTRGVVDNFGNLSDIVQLGSATGKVTIGNVDYSGYAAAAVIDVNGYDGAAVISGSQGGTAIIDNAGTNAIRLNNTAAADLITLQIVQTGVKDAGGAVTATQGALDSITGFGQGDSITLSGHWLGGDGQVIEAPPGAAYAGFLVGAEQEITVAGHTAYVAVIGGNTYVALAGVAGVAEIVEVMGIHGFTGTGDALVFAS